MGMGSPAWPDTRGSGAGKGRQGNNQRAKGAQSQPLAKEPWKQR